MLSFKEITQANLEITKRLHFVLFPTRQTFSYYRKLIECKESFFGFLVYFEEKCVGVFTIRRDEDKFYVMNFGVLSGYRRLGIGSSMFCFFLKKKEHYLPVCLHTPVERMNELMFYQKNGFYIEQRVKNYYQTSDAFYLIRKPFASDKETFLSIEATSEETHVL